MNPPSRFEIEKFANEKFQADLERRIESHAETQAQQLAQARSKGNSGGYLPALIQCKQEKLREEILALADAWVEAGTVYAVPLPAWVENALEKAAAEMAAGTASALHAELDLHARRTRTQHQPVGKGALRSTLNSALREGKLRLKTQRIKAERSQVDVSAAGLHSGTKPPEVSSAAGRKNGSGSTEFANWRSIREDFESLPIADWSLIWSSRPPVALFVEIQLESHWTWFHPADASLRARASAILLKAAKARGYDRADQWLDELRYADFAGFRISGHTTGKLPDGTVIDSESGVLKDAIDHSITLCHQLEAGCAPRPIIGRLPSGALTGMEDVRLALDETNPATSDRKGRKRGPKPDKEAASRVAEIVARVAPDGDWRPNLDAICEALDEAHIPFPARWRRRDRSCDGWSAYDERANAVKAIEYRLGIAKQRKKATPQTLS